MEKNEISIQEVLTFKALSTGSWMTNQEIAAETKVPVRTVRSKTKKFVDLGLCDQAEIFPAHRYRLSEKASARNKAYLQRLLNAKEILGL